MVVGRIVSTILRILPPLPRAVRRDRSFPWPSRGRTVAPRGTTTNLGNTTADPATHLSRWSGSRTGFLLSSSGRPADPRKLNAWLKSEHDEGFEPFASRRVERHGSAAMSSLDRLG